MLKMLFILITLSLGLSNSEKASLKLDSKYSVGDKVKCSQFEDAYWEGKVVKVVKDVIYQIELTDVNIKGSWPIYINASECTGKKRLSFEDGEKYNKTKIWIHERCID